MVLGLNLNRIKQVLLCDYFVDKFFTSYFKTKGTGDKNNTELLVCNRLGGLFSHINGGGALCILFPIVLLAGRRKKKGDT